jgi:hypothetical protein
MTSKVDVDHADRGLEEELDDPRRSLPSAGIDLFEPSDKLDGTELFEPSDKFDGTDLFEPSDRLDGSDSSEPSNHLGCPSVAPEGETAERVALGVGLPAWDRGGHRRSTSTTPIES